jgi:hypothetical protein
VPVVYIMSASNKIEIEYANAEVIVYDSLILDEIESQKVFERTGQISLIKIHITEDLLR